MTKIANPAKNFNYAVEMDGLDVATIQSIELPEIEISKDEHGDGSKDIKTPGRTKVGDIVMEKLLAEDTPDNTFWTWLQECANIKKGTNKKASKVKKNFFIKHLDGEGAAIRIWSCEGAWPFKFKQSKFGDKEEGNFMETVTFSVDVLDRLK